MKQITCILLITLSLISCKKNEEKANYNTNYTVNSSNPIDYTSKIPNKYSFVVMHTKNQFTGNRGIFTTGIFETSEYITEDEKYKLMDEAQSDPRVATETITKRELKSFESYAEASKTREQIMK